MEFQTFENTFFSNLNSQKDECLQDIENNAILIKEYFNENQDIKYVIEFLKKFNDILIQQNDTNLFEKVLQHPLFTTVLQEFRNSDILIKACQSENIPVLQWLLNMSINPGVKDEHGATALMYASSKPNLLFVVRHILSLEDDSNDYTDNKKETALFYAVNNINIFEELLKAKVNPDILNENNDSIFSYCCKNKLYDALKTLISCYQVNRFNPNTHNNDEMTGSMYLVKDDRLDEIVQCLRTDINFDYINSKKESVVSILIKKYYHHYKKEDTEGIMTCQRFLRAIVEKKCSMNIPIDEDGNTPLMFFIMIEDWHSIVYLLLISRSINLSVKNLYGINASYLAAQLVENKTSENLNIRVENVLRLFIYHKSFDHDFHDQLENCILIHYIYHNRADILQYLVEKNKYAVNDYNKEKETPLIIATKLEKENCVKFLTKVNAEVNHQDHLGNTALHYAVQSKNKYIISLLMHKHADINIKNNEGKSALDLANSSNSTQIIKLLKKPVKPSQILRKEKSKSKFSLFTKKSKAMDSSPKPLDENTRKYLDQYKQNDYPSPYNVSSSTCFTNIMQNNARELYCALNSEGEAMISCNEMYPPFCMRLPIVGGKKMAAKKFGREFSEEIGENMLEDAIEVFKMVTKIF